MKTLDKISKTLDIINKILTAIGWLAVIGVYGCLGLGIFASARGKKASTKIKEEESDA